jgi:hypothetical protein
MLHARAQSIAMPAKIVSIAAIALKMVAPVAFAGNPFPHLRDSGFTGSFDWAQDGQH